MTVAELIEALSKLPGSRRVVVDKGGEGSPLYAVDGDSAYRAETTWSGELKHPDDATPDDERVVSLRPVN